RHRLAARTIPPPALAAPAALPLAALGPTAPLTTVAFAAARLALPARAAPAVVRLGTARPPPRRPRRTSIRDDHEARPDPRRPRRVDLADRQLGLARPEERRGLRHRLGAAAADELVRFRHRVVHRDSPRGSGLRGLERRATVHPELLRDREQVADEPVEHQAGREG